MKSYFKKKKERRNRMKNQKRNHSISKDIKTPKGVTTMTMTVREYLKLMKSGVVSNGDLSGGVKKRQLPLNVRIRQKHMGTILNGGETEEMNCLGHPMVNLGEVPTEVLKDIENPSKTITTLRELQMINDLRITSPNGNKIYWGRGFEDSFFEGKNLDEEETIHFRTLQNSWVFTHTEEDGFTEDIVNDPSEMEKYMGWTVRLNTSCGIIDCPLDYYSSIFMNTVKQ